MWERPKNLKAPRTKKIIYIAAFVLLGFLVQQLVHALIEIKYIWLLIRDYDTWGLGFSWDTWFLIHHSGAFILLVLGLGVGFWQGVYWWGVLYEGKKRG